MPKPFVTNALGEFLFAGQTGTGRLFRKEVIREGTYQHPVNPWDEPLVADRAYLDMVARNTNEGISRGVEVPIPDTHADKPGDNKGYVRRAFVEAADDGSVALYVDAEIVDNETAEKLGSTIRKVSGWFTPFGDGEWTPGGDRLRHVALTNYPVASRQGNFVALSDTEGVESDTIRADVLVRESSPQPGEAKMNLNEQQSEAIKALGIDVPENGEVTETFLDALLAKAGETPPAPEAPKGADAAVKALSIDVSGQRYFGPYREARTKEIEATAQAAKTSGRLTEAGAKAYAALLSIDHAYALSDDGSAAQADVVAAAKALVDSIPENASIPVNERMADDIAGTQHADDKTKKFDAKDLAEKALSAAGLKHK